MSVFNNASVLADELETRTDALRSLVQEIDAIDDILLEIDSQLSDVNERDTPEEMFEAINTAIGQVNAARQRLRG